MACPIPAYSGRWINPNGTVSNSALKAHWNAKWVDYKRARNTK